MAMSGRRNSVATALVLTSILAALGCVHVKTPGERLDAAGALQAVGEYQRALDDLRALLTETPADDTVMRSVVHLRIAELLLLFKRTKEAAAEARRGLALDPRVDPSDWWSRTLVLLDDNKPAEAAVALRRSREVARVCSPEIDHRSLGGRGSVRSGLVATEAA
jgi:predicted Zn-dependent protease